MIDPSRRRVPGTARVAVVETEALRSAVTVETLVPRGPQHTGPGGTPPTSAREAWDTPESQGVLPRTVVPPASRPPPIPPPPAPPSLHVRLRTSVLSLRWKSRVPVSRKRTHGRTRTLPRPTPPHNTQHTPHTTQYTYMHTTHTVHRAHTTLTVHTIPHTQHTYTPHTVHVTHRTHRTSPHHTPQCPHPAHTHNTPYMYATDDTVHTTHVPHTQHSERPSHTTQCVHTTLHTIPLIHLHSPHIHRTYCTPHTPTPPSGGLT